MSWSPDGNGLPTEILYPLQLNLLTVFSSFLSTPWRPGLFPSFHNVGMKLRLLSRTRVPS